MRYRTYRLTLEYKTCWAIAEYNMYIMKAGIFPFYSDTSDIHQIRVEILRKWR